MQIDYEEAYAIAAIDDGLAVTTPKAMGRGDHGSFHSRVDEYVDPYFITYCYKPNSKRRQRFEQRERLKELLGRKHRSLVKLAQRNTKTRFLERLDSRKVRLRLILGLDSIPAYSGEPQRGPPFRHCL